MGRTNRTYHDRLESTHDELSEFRRALRHRDQAHYDRLWEHARGYADAAGYATPPGPRLGLPLDSRRPGAPDH